jgi:hypothetical protein
MALRRDNEYYDMIDGAVRDPNLDIAIKALEACRSFIASQATELQSLRSQQKNHDRQLAERDAVIAQLRSRPQVYDKSDVRGGTH